MTYSTSMIFNRITHRLHRIKIKTCIKSWLVNDRYSNSSLNRMSKLKASKNISEEAEDELVTIKDEEIDEDEDSQDWSQAVKLSTKSMISSIPKRGEKDYEPDGTNVQELLLYRARKAMFDTLANSPRGSIVSNQVKAYYDSKLHGAILPHPKGNFLQTMGSVDHEGRCWLDFQEFVYLAERGTVLPFYSNELQDIEIPLSMQDLYSLFRSQAEMDRYFIFAHLKRLGFIVTSSYQRRVEKTSFYPPPNSSFGSSIGLRYDSFLSFIDLKRASLMNAFFYTRWNFLLRRYTSTQKIYEGLKNLVPSVRVPKTADELRFERIRCQSNPTAPFSIAFNVWKPQTNFKKKSPGLPDFQVVIHNKNDASQHFPSYSELREIFHSLDYKFDFLNEIDEEVNWDNDSYTNGVLRRQHISNARSKAASTEPTPVNHLNKETENKQVMSHVKQLRRLKAGYRSFLLAIMDDGLISFVKISEADFGSENVWYIPSNQGSSTRPKRHGNIGRDQRRSNRRPIKKKTEK